MNFQSALTTAALLAVLGSGASRAATLTASNAQGKPGAIVPVDITTDPSTGSIAHLQFTLDFSMGSPDTTPTLAVQDAASLTPGPLMMGASLNETLPTATSLSVDLKSDKAASGSGVVLTVPLYIPDNAPIGATYALHLTGITATDAAGVSTPLSGQDGVLTVSTKSGSGGGMIGPSLLVYPGAGPAGGVATVEITAADTFVNVMALLFQLQFDPSLTAKESDVTVGDLLSGVSSVNDNSAGQLVIGVAANKAVSGPGHLAQVRFHIPPGAKVGAIYPIRVGKLQAVSADLAQIPMLAADSQVTVTAGGKAGDVNGDGVVDLKDALLALQSVVGLVTLDAGQSAAADLNGDGSVTIADVTRILRIAVGIDPQPA